MIEKEAINQVFAVTGGIAKTADLLSVGLTEPEVCALCNDGYIERIRHGYYQLAGNTSISEEQLLAKLIPEGIVCVESALFHYGYSDFAPREWSIAVPRTVSRAKLKIDAFNFKAYFIPKEHYSVGKTTSIFNGISLAVYDRDRTICDCFKYRTRIDNETFNKAIHTYVADDAKDLRNLSRYAKELGLYKKVMELMEVMLNG